VRPSKWRARLEMAGALCAGILGILTIFWHDWIEAPTGWDRIITAALWNGS